MTQIKTNDILTVIDFNGAFEVIRATEKALEIMTDHADPRRRKTFWIPKSQITLVDSETHPDATNHFVSLPFWLIKDKGLKRACA